MLFNCYKNNVRLNWIIKEGIMVVNDETGMQNVK